MSDRVIKVASASARAPYARVLDLSPLRDRAAEMLAEARRAVNEAREEVEQIREDARREGLEAGRDEGRQCGRLEGVERGLAEAADIRASLVEILDDLQRHRVSLKADAERHLMDLALAIAGLVVKARVELDPEIVRRNVAAALELITAADRIEVRVAPTDVEAVKAFLPELASGLGFRTESQPPSAGGEPAHPRAGGPHASALSLVPDPDVTRGGCVVRTAGGGEIDGGIATQLEEIARQLEA